MIFQNGLEDCLDEIDMREEYEVLAYVCVILC